MPTTFWNDNAAQPRPDRLADVDFPRREQYFPSPVDWRNEALYFLLPDRFSDGGENARPLVNRGNLAAGRVRPGNAPWRWDEWFQSGSSRWQGGTIAGVRSKLNYLRDLGITAIWIGPVFQQRGHLDTYHGYGIQDFLDVDPRFGARQDLVDLVDAAHQQGMRIILDVIFNHSGANWLYPPGTPGGVFKAQYTPGRHPFGAWRGAQGQTIGAIQARADGVWPEELQDPEAYTRAGTGSLGGNDVANPNAEEKRTDFEDLRDLRAGDGRVLNFLVECFKYWIALSDCDGFRIDTLKHVSFEEARNFCGAIKEFAANIGKHDFFLVGEIAGGDGNQQRYLEALEHNLNAALDIGDMRLALNRLAKGLAPPRNPFQQSEYFNAFEDAAIMGSHRNLGSHHVSVLDDHDHVFGEKVRFSTEAASDHQVTAGAAIQLFTLGIPCIYYGTEQAFAGPEPAERRWLPNFKGHDAYLREAMFGPAHPRAAGTSGAGGTADASLPGFGPFGTAGQHCFDTGFPTFRRIRAMNDLRKRFPVLRVGRQYLRQISLFGQPFDFRGPGEIVAWSRILDDEEALCVLNPHGNDARGADVIVDANLNAEQNAEFEVVLNTAQAALANPAAFAGPHPVGSRLGVQRSGSGAAFVAIRDLPPSEFLVLTNRP